MLSLLLVTLAAPAAAQDLGPALADRFRQGVSALEAGNLEAAEAAFRAVLQQGGHRPFVHHNLGIVLQRRGRHTAAVAEFHLASKLDPKYGPSRLLAGSSLMALGRTAEAVRELERAVALMPREPAARLQLADACERGGDVRCLVSQYRAVVALMPDEPEYAYRLGKAYLRLAQWSFARIQEIAPKSARLSEALGREYLMQGRPELARLELEEAARRDPRLPGIHLALAGLHLDEGRLEDAAREIERELAILPHGQAARRLKARIDAARTRQ